MRKATKAALVLTAALGAVAVNGTSASAEESWNAGSSAAVVQDTASGLGEAMVVWSGTFPTKTTPAYASAIIYNDTSGFTLEGWLERDHNGEGFKRISDKHALNNTTGNADIPTDAYYDGPGYMTRACFQFTSWAGAAIHCSPAI